MRLRLLKLCFHRCVEPQTDGSSRFRIRLVLDGSIVNVRQPRHQPQSDAVRVDESRLFVLLNRLEFFGWDPWSVIVDFQLYDVFIDIDRDRHLAFVERSVEMLGRVLQYLPDRKLNGFGRIHSRGGEDSC